MKSSNNNENNKVCTKAEVESVVNSRDMEIKTYKWCIDNPTAVILMAHGIGDYTTGTDDHENPNIGSCQSSANALNSRGYSVYALDFHGHGSSEGTRCLIEDFDHLVEEVGLVINKVELDYPDKDLFLLGESMGGAVTLQSSLKFQERIKGILLLAPMIKIAKELYPPASSITIPVLKAISYFAPAAKIVPGDSDKLLEKCTSNKQVVQDCLADENRYVGRQRLATALCMLEVTDLICRSFPKYTLPVLVMHGTGDLVTSHSFSELFIDKAGATDKTLKSYKDANHMLMVEVFDQVMQDISEWVDARI